MTLTKSDLQSIRAVLKPDFNQLEKKLSNKIENLRKSNRKDHNSILKYLDERDSRLEKRIIKFEEHCGLPPLQ